MRPKFKVSMELHSRCCSRRDKEFKYGVGEAKFWKWILFAVTFPISIVIRWE